MPDGDYVLTAVHSDKVLDVAAGSTEDGADVLQWEHNGGDNQVWRLRGLANGTYELLARHSGKLLTLQQPGGDGADVVQQGAAGSEYQRWYVDATEDGYRLSAQATGRSLDVFEASTANGANVLAQRYVYATNQKWQLTPVDPGPGL